MLSTVNSKETDPHPPAVEPEVVLAARIAREFSTLSPDAIRPPRMTGAEASGGGAAVPPVDTTFRATDVNAGRRPKNRWLIRALLAFMAALASAVAAGAWQYYGDTAQQMVAGYLPRLSLSLPSLTSSQPTPASETSAPVPQAAADQQTAAAAPSATDATAPAAPASPADQSQLVQSMANDLAGMKEQIVELKAVIDQLKAGQDQMMAKMADTRASEVHPSEARVAEPAPRPRPAPQPALRAAAAALHKPPPPRPAYTPIQAAPPQPMPPPAPAPMQLQPAPPPSQSSAEPQDEPVVRPPMPVR